MIVSKSTIFLVTLALFISFSCRKDDDGEPIQESRTITSLRLSLQSNAAVAPVEITYQDLDGNGGDDPVIQAPPLASNTLYFGNFQVLDESVQPTDDITKEIEADRSAFQFFYNVQNIGLDLTYADADDENFPVGLFIALRTGEAGKGNMIVTLIEGLNKAGDGVSEGDLAFAGGKIQLQATLPITIE